MIMIKSGSNIVSATDLKTDLEIETDVKPWLRTEYMDLHQHGLDRIVLPGV